MPHSYSSQFRARVIERVRPGSDGNRPPNLPRDLPCECRHRLVRSLGVVRKFQNVLLLISPSGAENVALRERVLPRRSSGQTQPRGI